MPKIQPLAESSDAARDWGCTPIDWEPAIDRREYDQPMEPYEVLPAGTRVKVVLSAEVKSEPGSGLGDGKVLVEIDGGWHYEMDPDEIVGVIDDD